MINIAFSTDFVAKISHYTALVITFDLVNTSSNQDLWKEINAFIAHYTSTHQIADIRLNAAIASTRAAYKQLGKDPNRYRPSAEALRRRILKEKSLYQIDTLVDLINLVSLETGYSIGGFDLEQVVGDTVEFGVGKAGEPFQGIGRGVLNIEGLPVLRDALGGIGTPTSDEERTKLSVRTKKALIVLNSYQEENLDPLIHRFIQLLEVYVQASQIEFKCYTF